MFQPEWGVYDMAIGKEIVSAYSGVADVNSFEDLGNISKIKTHKISYSKKDKELYKLYDEVRNIREKSLVSEDKITAIFNKLISDFPTDWLLPLKLFELSLKSKFSIRNVVKSHLNELAKQQKLIDLINNGINLCDV